MTPPTVSFPHIGIVHRVAAFVVGVFVVGVFLVGVLAACAGDPSSAGETLIEDELAEQIGLGPLDAECDEPVDDAIGTEFRCTATTDDSTVVEFLGVFTSDDEIYVSASNLLLPDEVDLARQAAAALLTPEVGVDVDPDDITCPDEDPLFLAGPVDEGVLECRILDPATGVEYELVMSLTGYDAQDGYQDLFVEIGAAVD